MTSGFDELESMDGGGEVIPLHPRNLVIDCEIEWIGANIKEELYEKFIEQNLNQFTELYKNEKIIDPEDTIKYMDKSAVRDGEMLKWSFLVLDKNGHAKQF